MSDPNGADNGGDAPERVAPGVAASSAGPANVNNNDYLFLGDLDNNPLDGHWSALGVISDTVEKGSGNLSSKVSPPSCVKLDEIRATHDGNGKRAKRIRVLPNNVPSGEGARQWHYLVRRSHGFDATGKPEPDDSAPFVAGQFGPGQPDVLRQIPTEGTIVSVFQCDDGNFDKRKGAGFDQIKHFFVLMLENRSFDHMLGHNPKLREVDGTLNPYLDEELDPSNLYNIRRTELTNTLWDLDPDRPNQLKAPPPNKRPIMARDGAEDRLYVDPGHEFWHAHWHLVGWGGAAGPNDLANISMGGFVNAYYNRLIPRRPDQGQFDGDAILGHWYPQTTVEGIQVDDIRKAAACNVPGAVLLMALPSGPTHDYIADAIARSNDDTRELGLAEKVMLGFHPSKLPVLNKLAEQFAVCDRWFSSLPGPTWPNRLFVHAGTSGGMETSPPNIKAAWREATATLQHYTFSDPITIAALKYFSTGFEFSSTVFSNMRAHSLGAYVYGGDKHPQVASVAGAVDNTNESKRVRDFSDFRTDLEGPLYSSASGTYTFIEPDYGSTTLTDNITKDFGGGGANSQHPISGVAAGESLIGDVYNALRLCESAAIRNHWALIVVYDEHGGFYDHVPPPKAVPPDNDKRYKVTDDFAFDHYGVRVPAVIISPLIPKGVTDHTIYDHTSVAATLRKRFGIAGMTDRDKTANDFSHLFRLTEPREMPALG